MARIIGRERANKISGPYHDWRARKRTQNFLARLSQHDLCVNLGCGYRPMKDWINVDQARGPEVQVVWDLRRGLPFQDESCTAIFSEHLIEHVPREDAERLLAECHRVLASDGVLRLSTPDAGRYLRSYAGDQNFLRDPAFGEAAGTAMDRVNQMMREYGQHLWVYDAESLISLLQSAGFGSAKVRQFGESTHPRMQQIDSAERAFESLYVEAIKSRKGPVPVTQQAKRNR
ncbi:MAG TPA: methyltransferase domain-containing protein [Pyrinomonadaceae bacterium]|nr:methyltransferase domain-containing protein [Pyrinomonadaceae bacterium]